MKKLKLVVVMGLFTISSCAQDIEVKSRFVNNSDFVVDSIVIANKVNWHGTLKPKDSITFSFTILKEEYTGANAEGGLEGKIYFDARRCFFSSFFHDWGIVNKKFETQYICNNSVWISPIKLKKPTKFSLIVSHEKNTKVSFVDSFNLKSQRPCIGKGNDISCSEFSFEEIEKVRKVALNVNNKILIIPIHSDLDCWFNSEAYQYYKVFPDGTFEYKGK